MSKKNPVALVLSGGGSQGAAEIGFYQALVERDIVPDFIVGTSVGAINGAFIASGLDVTRIKKLWIEISNQKLYRLNPELLWKWNHASSLFKPTGLKKFLNNRLPVKSFEELSIPLTVVATDLQEAKSLYIEKGPLVSALMASSAIPGYFPPRILNGHQLVDGAVANNIPIDKAYEKGASDIYCMLNVCRHRLNNSVQGLVDTIIRTSEVNQHQKLRADIQEISRDADLYMLDLCIDTHLSSILDFSKTEIIIEEAYQFARKALDRNYACESLPVFKDKQLQNVSNQVYSNA